MDLEKFIRDSAAAGFSRTATAAALDMPLEKFRAVLKGMPPLDWPGPGQSLDCKRAAAAMRGYCHPSHRQNLTKARAVERLRHLRTVRGVTGTIPELLKHFKLGISHSSVRRRLREGQSLEAALFTPPAPPELRRKKPAEPSRAPLSTWERVDIEFAGADAPMCM